MGIFKGRPPARNRINLALSDEAWDRLQKLKDDAVARSPIEVLQRALAVYEHYHHLMAQGATLKAHYPDGQEHIVEI